MTGGRKGGYCGAVNAALSVPTRFAAPRILSISPPVESTCFEYTAKRATGHSGPASLALLRSGFGLPTPASSSGKAFFLKNSTQLHSLTLRSIMVGIRTLWPAAAVLLASWLPGAAGIDLWVANDESVMPTSLFLSVSRICFPITQKPLLIWLQRPDITPPELDITVYKPEAITPGYIFLAPWRRPRGGPDHGPYIYDNDGVSLPATFQLCTS